MKHICKNKIAYTIGKYQEIFIAANVLWILSYAYIKNNAITFVSLNIYI